MPPFLRLPLPDRRHAGGRESVPGGVHPRLLRLHAELRLVYRGQFDDSRPKNDTPVTGRDLRAAVDTVLAGQAPTGEQEPSIGCNIKWKPGSEPDYFG